MTQLFTNNAKSRLASGITDLDTSLSVVATEGGKFPTPSGGDYFLLTLFEIIGTAEANHEIIKVTGRSGDTLTIERGQEGTVARAWSSSTPVELRITKDTLDQFIRADEDTDFSGTITFEDGKITIAGQAPYRAANFVEGTDYAGIGFANVFTSVQQWPAGSKFLKQNSSGEGGQFELEKSDTSTLADDVVFDLIGQTVRIFEGGGDTRGVTLDLTAAGNSVGSQLLHSGNFQAGLQYQSPLAFTQSGARWNVTARVEADGGMEIGQYLDFHGANTSADDYDWRVQVNGVTNPSLSFYNDNGQTNIRFSHAGVLEVSPEAALVGGVYVYGGTGTLGGRTRLYPGADETEVDYWQTLVDSNGDWGVAGKGGTSGRAGNDILIDASNGNFYAYHTVFFNAGDLRLGVQGTQKGQIDLYGGSGVSTGGVVALHNSTGANSDIGTWNIYADANGSLRFDGVNGSKDHGLVGYFSDVTGWFIAQLGFQCFGDIAVSGTVDGRDLAADGAIIDALPNTTISTSAPSGGSDGDVWYQV